MSLADRLRQSGWRRLVFAGFCLAVVLAGALYLLTAGDPGPPRNKVHAHQIELVDGFRRAVPLAMVLFGLLALASPWLIGRGALRPLRGEVEDDDRGDEGSSEMRRFWLGVLLATIAASTIWGQRMGVSLWTDEVTSMRLYSVGRWKHNSEGEGRLFTPTWLDTLFSFETPNNHVLYNVVARVVHERLVGINDSDFSHPYFVEWVLRLPALIAGLASIALVGYLALRLCSLLAAWLAMGWVVLHPWYLEFASSARGYSFAMCFLALAAVAAVQIVARGGGWRWWVVYGAGQLLAFLSIVTVAHSLIALNLAMFAGLLWGRRIDGGARRGHLGAFFASNLVALGFAMAAFLPRLEQFSAYTNGPHYRTEMSWTWMADCVSNLLIGQPYLSWSEENPRSFATEQWPFALVIFAVLLAVVLVISALWRCWRAGVFEGCFATLMLFPPLTTFLQGRAIEFFLFPWYVAFQVPVLLVILGVGAAALVEHLGKRAPAWCPALGGAILLLMVGIATQRPRGAYLSVPVEPQRSSAAVYRDSPNPYAPGHEVLISTSLVTANHSYDPWNVRLRVADDLWRQIAAAERSGKPLYLETAWLERVRKVHADVAAVLLLSGGFELVSKLYGLQRQNSRYVFLYRPGSLRVEAFERFPEEAQP